MELPLLQFGVLCFALLQNRQIGVRIFPYAKEILVCGTRLGGVPLCDVSSGQLQPRKRKYHIQRINAAVSKKFLKFSSCFDAIALAEVGFPANERRPSIDRSEEH